MPCQRTIKIKSSSKALKEVDHPNAVFALDFDFYSGGKPTYLARVLTSLFIISNIHGKEGLSMDISIQHDLITQIQLQADENQEELGKRMITYVDISLHRLFTNRYISYVLRRDENARITMTENLQKIFEKLNERVIASNKFNSLTEFSFKEHRALCNFFHTLMKRKTMAIGKARTQKQLLEENLDLRRDLEEALAGKITGQPNPLLHPSSINSNSSEATSTDPFIFDLVQFKGLEQNLKTPIRKTPMVDIRGSYPTPESLPRRLGIDSQAHIVSPPGTPTCSYHPDREESQNIDANIVTSSSVSIPATSLLNLLPISEIFGPNWTSEYIKSSLAAVGLPTDNQEWISSLISKCRVTKEESEEHKVEAHSLKSRLLRRMLRGRVSDVMNENKWKRKYDALKSGFQAQRTSSKAKIGFYMQCFQNMGAIASHAQSFKLSNL